MPVKLAPTGPPSYRDRTSELFSIAERLRKAQGVGSENGTSHSRAGDRGLGSAAQASGAQSEFNQRASKIGLSIHQTSQKLAKLAKLAKRTSMFDDPTVEIQELTAVIKQDITALNAAIADLQILCNERTESGKNKHTTEHSSTVVDNLKSRLMSTTKEFKDVLTLRTENLKVHQNRRQLFSAKPMVERETPTAAVARQGSTSTSGAAPLPWANNASSTASQLFTNPSRRRLSGEPNANQPLLQQQMVPAQDNFMASRAEALHNVESTIVELSNIFSQLATMVAQQGELAIRIDENMDDTLANVEGAQGALLRYLNRISSNRWLIIKIFFVLVAFLVFFIVFVA